MKKVKKVVKAQSGALWLSAVRRERDLNREQLELAKLAAEQLDIADEARAAVKEKGILIRGKFGMKTNPAVALARRAAESHAKLARMLRMACERKRPVGRPPLNQKTWEQQPLPGKPKSKLDDWDDFPGTRQ